MQSAEYAARRARLRMQNIRHNGRFCDYSCLPVSFMSFRQKARPGND